jgi:hypothetical protein
LSGSHGSRGGGAEAGGSGDESQTMKSRRLHMITPWGLSHAMRRSIEQRCTFDERFGLGDGKVPGIPVKRAFFRAGRDALCCSVAGISFAQRLDAAYGVIKTKSFYF